MPEAIVITPADQQITKKDPSGNPLLDMPDELIPEAWKDHVRDLRRENKKLREGRDAQESESKAAIEAAKKQADDAANARITEKEKAANDKVIRAELRVEAQKAGMVDLDGLKLADLSKVKLNEAGEVDGAAELMKALKEAKPYLFQAGTSTSSTEKTPPKSDSKAKDAKEMTADEWKRAKAKVGL